MTNDGEFGFLFEPGNSEDLLRQLNAARNCDWDSVHKKVLQQYKRKLSFEAIAAGITQIYESLP